MTPISLTRTIRRAAMALAVAVALTAIGTDAVARVHDTATADHIRSTERARLRALVDADMIIARRLHAGDFQLINPAGMALSHEEYLGFVATGAVDYLSWEPTSPISVRVHGKQAVIRYRSHIEVVVFGEPQSLDAWHTDVYEERRGQWQAVWSQATEIQPPLESASEQLGQAAPTPVSL